MESLVGGEKPYLKTTQLEEEHKNALKRAMQTYCDRNKYGRSRQSVYEKYQDQLEEVRNVVLIKRESNLKIYPQDIEKMYEKYLHQNESKNVFKAAKTPATLFSVLVLFYLLSGIFGLFGMYSFANVCNFLMGCSLLMLTLWAYVRYE